MCPLIHMEKYMRAPLQEKFQISVPNKPEGPEPWADFKSSRQSQADVPQGNDQFNAMPPGMEIADQCCLDLSNMPMSMAGESDVSADTNPTSFAEGFKKREMKGVDDQYTGEHVDLFYGDAGGFVERNNYLDRE